MQPAIPPTPAAGRAAAYFTVGFVVVVLAAFCGAFWSATQPWFMEHDAVSILKIMGYSFRTNGKNCDVVFYGDSTALAGLDPKVLQSETGLTACNIAEIRPVLEVVGVHLPLDQYLAHNRPPKFLVTAWAPGDFELEHPPINSYSVDGFLYEFQYNCGPWLWRALIRHPKDAISFLVWVQSSILRHLVDKVTPHHTDPTDERSRRDARNGVWEFPLPPQTRCDRFPATPWIASAKQRQDVARFKEQYASKAGHLVIDITPVADCFAEGKDRIASVEGLHDNAAQTWPIGNFNQLNIHLTSQGAERFTSQVAAQIQGIERQEREDPGDRSVATR